MFKERKPDANSSPRVDAGCRKVLEYVTGQMGWPRMETHLFEKKNTTPFYILFVLCEMFPPTSPESLETRVP